MGTPWVINPAGPQGHLVSIICPVSHWSYTYTWLVVLTLPLWKMMEWKSVGMMTFPIYGKIQNVPNQTTNQLPTSIDIYIYIYIYIFILHYMYIYIHIRQLHLNIRISKYTNWYFRLPLGRFLQHTYIIMYIYIYATPPPEPMFQKLRPCLKAYCHVAMIWAKKTAGAVDL